MCEAPAIAAFAVWEAHALRPIDAPVLIGEIAGPDAAEGMRARVAAWPFLRSIVSRANTIVLYAIDPVGHVWSVIAADEGLVTKGFELLGDVRIPFILVEYITTADI